MKTNNLIQANNTNISNVINNTVSTPQNQFITYILNGISHTVYKADLLVNGMAKNKNAALLLLKFSK